ncbi:hypothetical protein ACIQ7Q_22290 [Streptomyces sp. NPDC096176]|uniref:hypothetical protein n=1 Tax=Streptomyces sp. NPDC096176 TaxID=3366079 RepID=UPI00381AAC53
MLYSDAEPGACRPALLYEEQKVEVVLLRGELGDPSVVVSTHPYEEMVEAGKRVDVIQGSGVGKRIEVRTIGWCRPLLTSRSSGRSLVQREVMRQVLPRDAGPIGREGRVDDLSTGRAAVPGPAVLTPRGLGRAVLPPGLQ